MVESATRIKRLIKDMLLAVLEEHSNYGLVVTGHSLGAGVAAILSLLLRNSGSSRLSNLRCFAFSPPGGTLNKKAAIDSEAFCMSVVIGDDIVPRLSVYSVQLLIEQIWHELRKCQIPKYRVRIPNTNTKKMNMAVKET